MRRKLGYFRAKNAVEMESFRSSCSVDLLFIDNEGNNEKIEYLEYSVLLQTVKEGDTIVIQSLANLFQTIEESVMFVHFLLISNIKLRILDESEQSILHKETLPLVIKLLQLQTKMKVMSL